MNLENIGARLARGYRIMWESVLAVFARARGYRFAGERENHEDQLKQTRVSLSLMENAVAGDPDQTRMASEIEEDAENRLVVLLQKPRLTLPEKRERDAIQQALTMRRQGFAAVPQAPMRLGAFAAARASSGFLGAISSVRLWVWLSAALVAVSGLWMFERAGKMRVVDQRDEWRARARLNQQAADEWKREFENAHGEVIEANQQAAATAERLARERREAAALRRRAEERARDAQEILTRNRPPDWDSRLLDLRASGSPETGPDRDPGAGGDTG